LVLLKYVLTSLPVYALSFFKAPSGIISSIEYMFKCFFGEGVRIIEKFPESLGTMFVLERSMGGWEWGS